MALTLIRPPARKRLQRAAAIGPHLQLHVVGGSECRELLADDLVGRRPLHRLVAEVLVPDLADAGVVPADHVIADLRSGGDREGRGGNSDGSTESKNATHEISPDGQTIVSKLVREKGDSCKTGRQPFTHMSVATPNDGAIEALDVVLAKARTR